ncbi:alpha/beta hydrolase [Leisingera sp.]|uniref:alpha/beta hydrolase n=1 Tax=Leisingera sp. TaxID=1879318 RepID=UPI002B27BC76|nr:alpha/beta hydrolase [Leisingera sp.]
MWRGWLCALVATLAFPAAAQEIAELRIAMPVSSGQLPREMAELVIEAEAWQQLDSKVVLLRTDRPVKELLQEGEADLGFVPLWLASDPDERQLGVASILHQPFGGLGSGGTARLLETGFRDAALMDLGQRGFFTLSFASLGASSLISSLDLNTAAEIEGLKATEFEPDGTGLDALGASLQRGQIQDMGKALQDRSIEIAETLWSENVTSLASEQKLQSVLTGYSSLVLAAQVRPETWGAFSERQRRHIRAALLQIEEQSFVNAESDIAALQAQLSELGVKTIPFAEVAGEEGRQRMALAWAERGENRVFALELFETALAEAAEPQPAPNPEDEGGLVPESKPLIYFATDRERDYTGDLATEFGVEQITEARYHCGRVEWQKNKRRDSDNLYAGSISLAGRLSADNGCISDLAGPLKSQRVLLFIHGYSNSFETAVKRVIAVAEDVGWQGPVLLWSWPSWGERSAYLADAQHINDSRRRLEGFLRDLTQATDGMTMVLAAHSMGGRLGVEIVYQFAGPTADSLERAVFVAPDVSGNAFSDMIAHSGHNHPVTLYAHRKDCPLKASAHRFNNDQPRAGQGGPDLIVLGGLETVDASYVRDRRVCGNHTYTFDRPKAQMDLKMLLTDGAPACVRKLERATRNGTLYWLISRGTVPCR